MSATPFVLPLALALGLGLLVGLQREWATEEIAGIRTFTLITLFGTLAALLAEPYGSWTVGAGLLSLGALIVAGHTLRVLRSPEGDNHGVTTEVSALLMYTVGVALGAGFNGMAILVAGVAAVLLHWKAHLHGLVDSLGKDQAALIFRLALIAMVILPALPNETFGPYDVVNPFEVWLMVVLIVGISTAAYVAYKIFGAKWGTLLTGAMGGLISSTATTVSYSRRTREGAVIPAAATVVVMIASVVVFVRVLFEISLVAPGLLGAAVPPFATVMGLMLAITVGLWIYLRGEIAEADADPDPPSELGGAILFGLLYAAVLIGVAAAKDHFGNAGVYIIAVLSGLTDMDAITLSTAQLFQQERLDASTAWRAILLGNTANLVFKGAMAAVIGGRRMAIYVGAAFGVAIVGSGLVLWLWPS